MAITLRQLTRSFPNELISGNKITNLISVTAEGSLIFRDNRTAFHVGSPCENILHGYLYGGDLLFVILKEIYGFKFTKRFLEISSGDLTSFLLQLI
jgi:hypothetical protein